MAEVDALLLGPVEVRRDGEPLHLGGLKRRQLLTVLALQAGKVVSVDRLIDDLWGERPPTQPLRAIQVYVSQLRNELELPVDLRQPGYVLDLDPRHVDTVRFAELTAAGSALVTTDPESAGATLREALTLWRGPALADFEFEPFAQTDIARLDELRLTCIRARIDADLATGRHTDLVPELEALTRETPFDERLRAQLMTALYRSGRAPDALALYRATRQMLNDELGTEPGPELRELHAAILRDDESLLAPAPTAPQDRPAQRKLVSIVAVELEHDAGDDAEALHTAIGAWQTRTAAAVAHHGGQIQSIGDDAAVAVFGVPVSREDDLLRAARAALELREPNAHVGLESGEAIADSSLVAGPVLREARTAARAGDPGSVVLGPRARTFLIHAARIDQGSGELHEIADDAPPFSRRLDAALVGRKRELELLRGALDGAVRDGVPAAVRVVGAPGIGKTRLARELAAETSEIAVTLRGACVAEGSGATYRPLVAIVEHALGAVDTETIAARVDDAGVATVLGAALGAGEGAASAPEVAWAFRRLCEHLAAERPLTLVFDDVQWAEPTLLDVIGQLVERSTEPILVVCLAREELLDEQPDFLADAAQVELDVLSAAETSLLLRNLLGGNPLGEGVVEQITASAEGNPLFVEQLLAFVSEEGTLVERSLPPTIQALLAARLERLGPGERAVLSHAAVIGRRFPIDDLTALLGRAETSWDRHLATLTGRGYVRRTRDGYRFRHALVREAVYRTTAKSERAELHERLADHLGRRGEGDARVGYHLERAYMLQTELGLDDRRVRQLAADAGTRLGAAGLDAWKRNDVPATVGLLRRATALLGPESLLARRLTCELGIALRAGGDADGAVAALEQAARAGSSTGDAQVELRARMELAFVRLLGGSTSSDHELLELAETAIPTFEALDDDRALGRAWLLTGYVRASRHLQYDAGRQAAELALVHYQRAGYPAATPLLALAAALYDGSTPADAAATRCEELLAGTAAGPGEEANLVVHLGGLLAMLGRPDDGRRLVERGRAILTDLGQLGLAATIYGAVAGAIEILVGDLASAERLLTESCALLQSQGMMSTFASRAGELAGVLYRRGRYDEAAEWLAAARPATAADDVHARLASQPVEAKLLARAGELDRAVVLALDAAALAEQRDAPNIRARVFLDVGDVLNAASRGEESATYVERARGEYAQKGNRLALTGWPAATRA